MKVQPIIYSRPLSTRMGYRWFVRPQCLVESGLIGQLENRVNVVLDTSLAGNINGRRYHVLRLGGYVIVGAVTKEFGYTDGFGRAVRGYYGVVLDGAKGCCPTTDMFSWLNEKYVKNTIASNEDFSVLDQPWEDAEDACFSVEEDVKLEGLIFNHNRDNIFLMTPSKSLRCKLIMAAVQEASCQNDFEFVDDFQYVSYAITRRVMNAVCSDCMVNSLKSCANEKQSQRSDVGKGSMSDNSERPKYGDYSECRIKEKSMNDYVCTTLMYPKRRRGFERTLGLLEFVIRAVKFLERNNQRISIDIDSDRSSRMPKNSGHSTSWGDRTSTSVEKKMRRTGNVLADGF